MDVDAGNGDYDSEAVTVTEVGVYTWVAKYNSDARNLEASHACGLEDETVTVGPNQPGITTVAMAPDATLPTTELFDTAKVSPVTGNLDTAVANVDFRLYGPGDTNCTGEPVFVSLNRPVTVVADGQSFYATAESAHYNALLAGKYRWTAHFDGDANNADADSLCNATNEDSTVEKANPAISTTATSGTLPPGTITDTATLTGVTESAGGSITFRLYGPSASPNCSGAAVFTSAAVPVSGPGTYGPVTATVTAGGSYYWIASYSGDANNNPVAGTCGDAGETSVVRVLQGALNVTKAVSPVAGGGVVVEFGDTLTYTLTVSATGELTQHDVKVSDYIPGYDPARPTSGKTTYVAGRRPASVPGPARSPSRAPITRSPGRWVTWRPGRPVR